MTNNGNMESNTHVVAPLVESKKNHARSETGTEVCFKQKLDGLEKDRPACCNHYFGYLGVFQRTETLDECYFCPKLLECCKKASVKSY